MCVEPILVFKQRAKQQRYLPMLISFGAGRKQAGTPQNAAPVLNKVRFAVARMIRRQRTGKRRH
jgi:hypothetical protein